MKVLWSLFRDANWLFHPCTATYFIIEIGLHLNEFSIKLFAEWFTRCDKKIRGLVLQSACNVMKTLSLGGDWKPDVSATNAASCNLFHLVIHNLWAVVFYRRDFRRLWFLNMDEFKEQRVCVKFCVKLGKTGTETLDMVQQAFGECSWLALRYLNSIQCKWFKEGRTSIDDNPRPGRPLTFTTDETKNKILEQKLLNKNRRLTLRELSADFFPFPRIKRVLKGRHFETVDEIKVNSQNKEIYAAAS